ncbi:oxidoreductase, putative [Trypanosoma cruzi marinkellei]|uniref:Oxidoreductase, putative n=1 Tax=Trypanosoma cruzi marinkellei TaxID=85056 RepID=K2MIH6_TRYCR|nr:oxidoreductase, putative [Trypanosoma cruzi marinkellei]
MTSNQPVSSCSSTLRVGILGVSNAARRALRVIHRAGLLLVAVGAEDVVEAENFVNACLEDTIERKTEHTGAQEQKHGDSPASEATHEEEKLRACTYEELVICHEVDVVYVTVPIEERDSWVRRCIRQRKHILTSIPAAPSGDVLQKWVELASVQRLFLTDDAVLMQGTRMGRLWEMFNGTGDNTVGPLRAIRVCCSGVCNDHCARAQTNKCDDEDSKFGVLGNWGWMAVAAVMHGMRYTMPSSVLGRALRRDESKGDCVKEFSGELLFTDAGPQEVTAYIYVADAASSLGGVGTAEQSFTAYGTTGSVTLHDFIIPMPDEDGSVHLTVSSHDAVQGKQLYRIVRHEKELRVHEPVTSAELPWRRLRDELSPNPHAGASRLASRFLTDTEEATECMRHSWSTQVVIDAMLEATTKSTKITRKNGERGEGRG